MAINGSFMKKGFELNLTVIKCVNKTGTDKLKELHRRANSVLYPNTYRYIDPKLANAMFDELCAIGKELNELVVPEAAKAKKMELIQELRTRCTSLKDYRKLSLSIDDVPQMQATLNFFVHQYIDLKKADKLTTEQVLPMLVESRRLWDAFCAYEQHLNTASFISVNGELVRWFERYTIRKID